jgi:ribA/ribD-fused uncharacterized protein
MAFCFYFYFLDRNCPLSNFYPAPFDLDARRWKTVEHWLQASRVSDPALAERIRLLPNAEDAARIARLGSVRTGWAEIQTAVMRRGLEAKIRQNAACRQFLLDSGDTLLVLNAPWDYVWGCGADGSGKNLMGEILMEIRSRLQAELEMAKAERVEAIAAVAPIGTGATPIATAHALAGGDAPPLSVLSAALPSGSEATYAAATPASAAAVLGQDLPYNRSRHRNRHAA